MSLRVLTIIAFVICVANHVSAQSVFERRLMLSGNAGVQIESSTRTDVVPFSLHRELGSLRATQTLGPYFVFDGGAALRVWKRVGVGLSVSQARGQSPAAIEASVPHPFFFDFDRTGTASTAGLSHRETAYHLYAQIPFAIGASTLLTFSAGPTHFDVSQELVAGIETAERGFPFDDVDILPNRFEKVSASGWGYNVGVDLAYFGLGRLGVFDRLGVGFLVRYSKSKPRLELLGVRQERLRVGFVHAVGGIRLAF